MYYIGVDLGGTNIAIGIVNNKLEIIDKGSVPTNANRAGELIIKDMAALTDRLLKDAGIPLSDVAYVGIASPGTVDSEKGVIEYANNLPFFKFPIADIFKRYLPVKSVLVENDANAAALGEALAGSAKGSSSSVMITLGTGVGGGIVLDGQVYAGFNFAGAELGHIVIEKDGRPCSCGRKGCWEAYSSATGLINMTRDKLEECRKAGRETQMEKMIAGDFERISGKTAFSASKQGDAAAIEVVNEYIDYLACGLANIINIFQPDVLSIGGGICREGDYLLKPLEERVFKEVYTKTREPKTKLLIAQRGNDAGIIGAASLGR